MDQFSKASAQHRTLPATGPAGSRWIPWTLVAIYFGFAVAWTGLTGFLLRATLQDQTQIIRWDTYKDWLFVFISTGLLVILVRQYVRKIQQAKTQISLSEAHYRRLIETASEAIIVFVKRWAAEVYDHGLRSVVSGPCCNQTGLIAYGHGSIFESIGTA